MLVRTPVQASSPPARRSLPLPSGEPEEQDLGCAQEGWSNENELPCLLIKTQISLNPVRSLPSTSTSSI